MYKLSNKDKILINLKYSEFFTMTGNWIIDINNNNIVGRYSNDDFTACIRNCA